MNIDDLPPELQATAAFLQSKDFQVIGGGLEPQPHLDLACGIDQFTGGPQRLSRTLKYFRDITIVPRSEPEGPAIVSTYDAADNSVRMTLWNVMLS